MIDPTIEIPYCYTCPFWDVFDYYLPVRGTETQADGETTEEFILRLTESAHAVQAPCHRHAPRFADVSLNEPDDDVASWPRTDNYDWCGEHPDFPAYLAAWRAKRDAVRRGERIPDA